jgi:tetratricopeptide (TPR) repeat protein
MNSTEIGVLYLLAFRLSMIASGVISIILGYRLLCKGFSAQGGQENNSTIEASVIGTKLTVRNAAPGTAFAIFGAAILIVMMIQNAPSVTLENLSKLKTNETTAPYSPPAVRSSPDIGVCPVSAADGLSRVGTQNAILQKRNNLPPQTQKATETIEDAKVVLRGTDQSTLALLTARGIEFEKRKDFANAERSYREAVNLMAEPINDLAWRYLKAGRADAALKLATIAVQLSPDEDRYKRTAEDARGAIH